MTQDEATSGKGMTPEQHLYSDAIYRINSVVESIVEKEDDFFGKYGENIQLWPTQFDSFSGEFRWLLLRKGDWRFNREFLTAIKELKKPEINFWEPWGEEKNGNWKTLANTWPEKVDRTNPYFGEVDGELLPELWNEVFDKICNDTFIEEENLNRHHHAFMKLLEGRSFPKNEYHDGIVLGQITEGGKRELAPVLLDRIHSTRDEKEKMQDGRILTRYKEVECYYYGTEHKEVLGTVKKPSAKSAEVGWQVALQGAIARDLSVDHMISIPIYDGGQAGPCYGRLVGIIHGAILKEFEGSKTDRNRVGKEIAERVRRHNDELVAAFRAADTARIARESVSQEDRNAEAEGMSPVLHHFLRVLPMVQDWNCVQIKRQDRDGSWEYSQYWTRKERDWVKVNVDQSEFQTS